MHSQSVLFPQVSPGAPAPQPSPGERLKTLQNHNLSEEKEMYGNCNSGLSHSDAREYPHDRRFADSCQENRQVRHESVSMAAERASANREGFDDRQDNARNKPQNSIAGGSELPEGPRAWLSGRGSNGAAFRLSAGLAHGGPQATGTAVHSNSGERLKREGMSRAAMNRAWYLGAARSMAVNIAAGCHRPITIDDVFTYLPSATHYLGNAAGSVFKGKEWEFVGWVKSTRPSNHSRYVKSWRLK